MEYQCVGPGSRKVVCAANFDDEEAHLCQGYSGGPLFCNDMQVGITSFGSASCSRAGGQTYYTDVYAYRNWIYTNDAGSVRLEIAIIFLNAFMKFFNYVLQFLPNYWTIKLITF